MSEENNNSGYPQGEVARRRERFTADFILLNLKFFFCIHALSTQKNKIIN